MIRWRSLCRRPRTRPAQTDRLSAYLPLQNTPLADVTIEELVTHASGLPRDSAATLRSGLWRQPTTGSASTDRAIFAAASFEPVLQGSASRTWLIAVWAETDKF